MYFNGFENTKDEFYIHLYAHCGQPTGIVFWEGKWFVKVISVNCYLSRCYTYVGFE
jgi:hypothetical protein